MSDALRLQGYREPLGLWSRRVPAPPHEPVLRAFRFEYSSRGDRVGGRLWLPGGERGRSGEHPLLLLGYAATGSPESPDLDASAAAWTDRGAALATIDLPLHGARSDRKLAVELTAAFTGGRSPGGRQELLAEFARQAVIDLERALDALAQLEGVDAERVAYAGFGLGAMLGAAFCALDPRPRAAALARAGAGLAPEAIDPGGYIGRFAPRPLLLVNADPDATIPREAATALQRAARPPVEQRFFEATSAGALPRAALEAIWAFLAPHLDLSAKGG